MGQIVSSAAKPKRCNLQSLSQFGTPAAGEYILVSSDNSMNAAGQGNFDCYVVGDGTTAATTLTLHKIDKYEDFVALLNSITSYENVDDGEEVVFTDDNGTEEYAKIDENGLRAKSLKYLDGAEYKDVKTELNSKIGNDYISVSEVAGTEKAALFTSDDESETYAKIDKDGVHAKKYYLLNGSELETGATLYVSESGSDNNDGSSASPLATFNAALRMGADCILVGEGVYNQTIDLSLVSGNRLKIATATYKDIVIIKSPNHTILNNGGETLVSGTTKVYQVSTTSTLLNSYHKWIYQEGVADATTLITNAERHPLQRGKEYRLESTRITLCDATSVQDAITEIESADTYKYFHDSTNGVLYFSRPQTTSTSYPLCAGANGANLFANNVNRRDIQLEMCGIDVWYQCINLNYLTMPRLSNCAAKYACASGGIMWSCGLGAIIDKCEAAAVQYNTNGDGFNAGISNYPEGDAWSHKNSAWLIDCWAHDVYDDGYSSHPKCETTIQGGLFEYCGKGGVTPSYGDHIQCYNALSRKNFRGFYYTGEVPVAEGGKYGQAIFYGCISQDNSIGGIVIDGAGNRITAVGCKVIGNTTAFISATNTTIQLIDCGILNNASQSSGSGTIEIINTNTIN